MSGKSIADLQTELQNADTELQDAQTKKQGLEGKLTEAKSNVANNQDQNQETALKAEVARLTSLLTTVKADFAAAETQKQTAEQELTAALAAQAKAAAAQKSASAPQSVREILTQTQTKFLSSMSSWMYE